MANKPVTSPASGPSQTSQNTSPPKLDPASTTTDNANNKRKSDENDADNTTVQTPQPIQKRLKTTLIDDLAAIAFLLELGLDQHFFDGGKVLAWGLQPNDPDYHRIHKYVARGEELGYGIKILSILRILPSVHTLGQDPDSYLDFQDDPKAVGMKRMMLWHGTKRHYVKSILENGLKLPNHPGLYGTGIYFADMVSKSCHYTDHYASPGKVGYLFLNDVLLGNTYKAYDTNYTLRKPPPINVPWWNIWGQQQYVPRQSVKGTDVLGGYGPSSLGDVTIDGCTWPLGHAWGLCPIPNEYIIYDAKQVKPKFLVKFEYTKKHFYIA